MKNDNQVADTKGTLFRMWTYLKKYRLYLGLVLLFIVLNVSFNILSSFYLNPIIDDYILPMVSSGASAVYLNGLIRQLFLLVLFAFLASVSLFFQYRFMVIVAQNVVRDMRKDLFDRLSLLPIRFFDHHPHGELMSRIINDMDNVSTSLNSNIDQIVSGFFNVFITLIVMFTFNVPLSLIALVSIPIFVLVSLVIMKRTKKHFVYQQEAMGDLNSYIEEYISGQKVIKAFHKEKVVKENFKSYNDRLRKEGFKAQAYGAVVVPVMSSMTNMAIAIICIAACMMAISGRISVGLIAVFLKLANQFYDPLNNISQQANIMQAGLAGAERVFEIIDEKEEFYGVEGNNSLPSIQGAVRFDHVSFGYDPNSLVLKDISLDVKPGETVAIVGPTGAGKTTIVNLLSRFYDVNQGHIFIDGVDISSINVRDLRPILGIVLQDTVLFHLSVKENIRFGKLDATDEEVIQAAKLANADSFISKLSDGYDTILNEDVTNLSIGQKQLLNIARVILNDPKILILDEATSNVDTRTEKKLNEAMLELMKGRTCFVIAHRLSTIRNADKIVVIQNGQIVEVGDHEALMKNKNLYYEMYTGMFQED